MGRIDIVENRFVCIKSRGCYETLAGTVLRAAHLDLEGITMDREVMRIRDSLAAEFARLRYNGFWYAPEMELVMHSVDFSQRHISGGVEVKLYKGNCTGSRAWLFTARTWPPWTSRTAARGWSTTRRTRRASSASMR